MHRQPSRLPSLVYGRCSFSGRCTNSRSEAFDGTSRASSHAKSSILFEEYRLTSQCHIKIDRTNSQLYACTSAAACVFVTLWKTRYSTCLAGAIATRQSYFSPGGRGKSTAVYCRFIADASASRRHCQEVLATQGVILAESLRTCSIPVRVSSFCSLRGYTILHILKPFDAKNSQSIFQYFSSGWNRDGLVMRAAGDLLTVFPGSASRHLIIILTDASPNDSLRVQASAENPFGHDYGDAFGVHDTAVEVRALRAKDFMSPLFSWENPRLHPTLLLFTEKNSHGSKALTNLQKRPDC